MYPIATTTLQLTMCTSLSNVILVYEKYPYLIISSGITMKFIALCSYNTASTRPSPCD